MSHPKLLLVGWDAADWKLITPMMDRGEMPVFSQVIAERGVMGDLSTLQPVLSPMLWNSIATGKRADEHGILGFTEVDATSGRVRPVSSTARRTKAIWNILSQQGFRTNVAGWFASHPAEPIRGGCVSDAFARGCPVGEEHWPLFPGTIYPEQHAAKLEACRIRPREIGQEILRLFIPRLDEVDFSRPHRVGVLAHILAECFSTHAAATWLMDNSPWDFMGVYHIGIDHFSHAFMNYHPPCMEGVDEQDYELYKDVVSGGYRLMDLFLGRMLQLAGPETTLMVLSDHGFHSDHLRPREIPRISAGPATQHRHLGVFGVAGPGIRRDERIYGAGLLDIAPTVLAIYGLAPGADMPGRVLTEVFERAPSLERVPTWETIEGESGMHPPGTDVPMEDADALIRQFVALGYVAEQPEDRDEAARECRRDQDWNLARVYTSTGRFAAALPLLEGLSEACPARGDFALALADCQVRLGLTAEALERAEATAARHPRSPVVRFVLGQIAFAEGRFRESLAHLLEAEELGPAMAGLHVNIGFTYMKLRNWEGARRALEHALELDPHCALAMQGLARFELRAQRPEQAASLALQAVGCRHDLPFSHFWLGVALSRLGQRDRAIQAFETSLTFPPAPRIAHRMLAALYGNTPEGRLHAAAARDFLRLALEQRREQQGPKRKARRPVAAGEARDAETGTASGDGALSFLIVSGLPRSGTSLMMKILEAAGLPVMTDGERGADEDNPEGYYEWEAIKKVGSQPALMREAEGKVLKVISLVLSSLPREHSYKVIFMDRPVEEVVRSQSRMLQNRGETQPASEEKMVRALREHRENTLRGLRTMPGFELLVVDYPKLVASPEEWIVPLEKFTGVIAMGEALDRVIRPELYRNRGASFSPPEEPGNRRSAER